MTKSVQPIALGRPDAAPAVSESSESALPHIGMLNEGSLHASLKRRYARPGDDFEVSIEGFVIDIVRARGEPDELLIEIQTGSFRAMANMPRPGS